MIKNVSFPNKNIYIFENHNWAFAAWETYRLRGKIKNATLVHVDGHLDDLPDGTQVDGLLDIKNEKDCYEVASKLEIANFIWAGIATDAIQHPLYISHIRYGIDNINDLLHVEYDPEDDKVMYETLKRKDCTAHRVKYIEDFEYEYTHYPDFLRKHFFENKSLVLDLDLDYFNDTDDLFEDNIMEEERIKENLIYLRDNFAWDLITVALSPLYCGSEANSQYLLDIFIDVFELDVRQAENITYIN